MNIMTTQSTKHDHYGRVIGDRLVEGVLLNDYITASICSTDSEEGNAGIT